MCKHLLKIQRLILALLIFGGGIFYTSSALARVCFLPDSTDCGEGDVDVPEVQITCATYGGYEEMDACLEARTNKTAQTCTLNSGCYYPKCAYDSERNCKNDNPDKKCLSQDVDGVKCWYAQAKTCSEQGYKNTPCTTDEDSGTVPNTLEASDGPCYKCTPKKECKQMKPGVYYGPNDTCPQYRPDRKEVDNVKGLDGQCSTCDYQTCSYYGYQTSCAANQSATEKLTKDQASDGPCYTCVNDDNPSCYDTVVTIECLRYGRGGCNHDCADEKCSTSRNDKLEFSDGETFSNSSISGISSSGYLGPNVCRITAKGADAAAIYGFYYKLEDGSYSPCVRGQTCVIDKDTEYDQDFQLEYIDPKSKQYRRVDIQSLVNANDASLVISLKNTENDGLVVKNESIGNASCKNNEYYQRNIPEINVCDTSKTCSKISNGTWKGEKDKNTCPTGYKPEVVESTIGATAFSDGPCYKCEKIEDKTITIYLTNTETKDQSSSTLICNRQIERVNSTTKEYVEFSHDSNHTVKLRLNGPNKPCTELYADPIVLEEDNSYDLYAEFPSGNGSISGYYYDNVPTSFEVIVDGVVVASDEIRRGKIDNTNWTHLRVLSSLNGKVIQPSKSNPYTIKFVYENEKNNTCYKESSSGTVANKSTIYYYPADELYVQGACASEMTLNVVCDNTNLKAKLYVNGKETQANPNSYQNTEGKWFGDFMNCTGCATVECTFKYGDKTKITIPQTGGPGD